MRGLALPVHKEVVARAGRLSCSCTEVAHTLLHGDPAAPLLLEQAAPARELSEEQSRAVRHATRGMLRQATSQAGLVVKPRLSRIQVSLGFLLPAWP